MKKMPNQMQITNNSKHAGSYMWLLRRPYGRNIQFGVKAVTATELLLCRYWGCDECTVYMLLIAPSYYSLTSRRSPASIIYTHWKSVKWDGGAGEFHCVSVTQRQWRTQKLCAYTHDVRMNGVFVSIFHMAQRSAREHRLLVYFVGGRNGWYGLSRTRW